MSKSLSIFHFNSFSSFLSLFFSFFSFFSHACRLTNRCTLHIGVHTTLGNRHHPKANDGGCNIRNGGTISRCKSGGCYRDRLSTTEQQFRRVITRSEMLARGSSSLPSLPPLPPPPPSLPSPFFPWRARIRRIDKRTRLRFLFLFSSRYGGERWWSVDPVPSSSSSSSSRPSNAGLRKPQVPEIRLQTTEAKGMAERSLTARAKQTSSSSNSVGKKSSPPFEKNRGGWNEGVLISRHEESLERERGLKGFLVGKGGGRVKVLLL